MLLAGKTRGKSGSCGHSTNASYINGQRWIKERSVSIAHGLFEPTGDFCVEFEPEGEPAVQQALAVDHAGVRLQFSVCGLDQQPLIQFSGVPHKHTKSEGANVLGR